MAERVNPPLPVRTHHRVRYLRRGQTNAEQRLWYQLRAGRLGSYKFRRQYEIGLYIVDLYCAANKLAIALDGSQRNQDDDIERTQYLKSQGIRLLRFWDSEVLENTAQVLQSILDAVENPALTPTYLPTGEGLQGEAK